MYLKPTRTYGSLIPGSEDIGGFILGAELMVLTSFAARARVPSGPDSLPQGLAN
jgi:hypothetical protein